MKTIKVKESVTRSTEYVTITDLSVEAFKRLDAALSSDDYKIRRRAEEEANNLVNVDDWQDDNLESINEFGKWVEGSLNE